MCEMLSYTVEKIDHISKNTCAYLEKNGDLKFQKSQVGGDIVIPLLPVPAKSRQTDKCRKRSTLTFLSEPHSCITV